MQTAAHKILRGPGSGPARDNTPDWLHFWVRAGNALMTWFAGPERIGHELIDIGWQLTLGPDVLQVDLCSTVQHRAGRSIRQWIIIELGMFGGWSCSRTRFSLALWASQPTSWILILPPVVASNVMGSPRESVFHSTVMGPPTSRTRSIRYFALSFFPNSGRFHIMLVTESNFARTVSFPSAVHLPPAGIQLFLAVTVIDRSRPDFSPD